MSGQCAKRQHINYSTRYQATSLKSGQIYPFLAVPDAKRLMGGTGEMDYLTAIYNVNRACRETGFLLAVPALSPM